MRLDRIGIVMLTAVGDAVHVLPVVNAIKRAAPGAHITWLLQPGPASLISGHPAVDEILVFERKRGVAAFLDMRRELASRPFDVVLDLQTYLKAGILTALTRAPVKIGYDRARGRDANWIFTNQRLPSRPMRHVQDEFLEFLEPLGIAPQPLEWKLGPWPHEIAWQNELRSRFDRPMAALVIGTSKAQKDWLPDRWAEVADALWREHGLQPVLHGGRSPRELETEAIMRARCSAPLVSLLGCSLRELVGALQASELVISPDTGPLHMAVALERPVIALMGYTNPKRVGPFGRYQDLIVDAYGDPGEDYPLSAETRLDRMPRITVEDVLGRVGVWEELYR